MDLNAMVRRDMGRRNGRLIVAICSTTGPGSGKSTYLRDVVRKQLPNAEHLRFSDPIISFLVDGLKPLHGKTRDDYEELKRLELLPGITGRDFMIAAGESLRNTLSPSFYADLLMKRIKESSSESFIIDDLRKMPEILRLIASGHRVQIVNVLRPGCGDDNNDCEFSANTLRELTRNRECTRYMEVTWDGKGSFVTRYHMRRG